MVLTRRLLLGMALGGLLVANPAGSSVGSHVAARQPEPPTTLSELHVDRRHARTDDANPGTAERPLETVGESVRRAMANRQRGLGTRVVIHPGVYRETVELSSSTNPASIPPVIIEGLDGTGRDPVVLSGSDIWTGWSQAPGTQLYGHPMPLNRGFAPLPEGWDDVRDEVERNPVILRGEAVFVSGRLYRQVLSRRELEAEPQRFYVDERDGAATATLWVHLPSGKRPAEVTIEVAVRPTILSAVGVDRLTIRNLVIQHAASQLQDAALHLDRCTDVVVERVEARWNNWNGIGLFNVRDLVLRHVAANHNGAGGFGAWKATNLTVEDVEASYNNWRGAWGEFLGWATGHKFFHVHGARFTRLRAVGNAATALWFDTDASDVVIDHAVLADNATRGMFIEAIQGPMVVRDSTIRDNGEIGILSTSASHVTLERNVITGNREHQVVIPWQDDHHVVRTVTDARTNRELQIRSTHWTLTDNTIGTDGEGLLFSVGKWPHFLETFRSSGNRWFRAGGAEGLGVYLGKHLPVWPMTLAEWRRLTAQDADSTFRD